jgi:hypothetical protein
MRLNAPKVITFWIAVILALVGILGFLGHVPVAANNGFWLLAAGFVLLALSTLLKGL